MSLDNPLTVFTACLVPGIGAVHTLSARLGAGVRTGVRATTGHQCLLASEGAVNWLRRAFAARLALPGLKLGAVRA